MGGGKWELCGRREMGERAFSLFIFFTFSILNYVNVKQGGKEAWHSLLKNDIADGDKNLLEPTDPRCWEI